MHNCASTERERFDQWYGEPAENKVAQTVYLRSWEAWQAAIRQAATRDTPSFEATHISTKEKNGKIILTVSLDALESAPRFSITPINPCVVRAATRDDAPSADAVDAQRYRWLLDHPEHVEFDDFYDRTWLGPMATVSDAIDVAIAAYAPKESK